MKFLISTLFLASLLNLSTANPVFKPSSLTGSPLEVAEGVIGWLASSSSSSSSSSEEASNKDGKMRTMDSWSYTNCGLPTDAIQLKSITVSPDPPVPGKPLSVTAVADVLETIEEGAYADVLVKLGLIKLLQKRFDVCEEARNANASVQCPVAPGPYEVTQTVDLPKEIPHAKFQVQVRGFTAEDQDMLCADIFVDFMKGKPNA